MSIRAVRAAAVEIFFSDGQRLLQLVIHTDRSYAIFSRQCVILVAVLPDYNLFAYVEFLFVIVG